MRVEREVILPAIDYKSNFGSNLNSDRRTVSGRLVIRGSVGTLPYGGLLILR